MKNTELIRAIEAGRATPSQLRLYVRRVTCRAEPEPCAHGHFNCALVEGGPCLDECLSELGEGGGT